MDLGNNSKKLLKGTMTYALGDFGTKILTFLIVPLYTYYISTSEMGIYDLLISTVGLLLPIVTLQISDAAYCWIISAKREAEYCIKATYDILIVTSVVFMAIIGVVNYFIYIPYGTYFVILLICSSWYSTIAKLIRGFNHQKLYALLGFLFTFINLSLNIIQVIVLKRGIEGLLLSSIWAYIICFLFALWKEPMLYNIKGLLPDKSLKKSFIRFSVPLIPNYLNWWLINSSDSYVVTFALGSSANGVLSLAHKFPAVMQTIISLFNSAWQDLAVSENKKNGEYYTEVFDMLSRVLLGLLLVIIPITKIFVCLVMNNDYQSSADYIPMYYLGAVYQGFSSFYGVGYLRDSNTARAFSTSICAASINLIVDILLINRIGIHAASVSTFIGFFIMWLIREKQNREKLGIAVNWHMIIPMTMLDCLVALISIKFSILVNLCLFVFGGIIFLLIDGRYVMKFVDMLKINKK